MWFFQDRIWSGSLPVEIGLIDFPRQSAFQVADPLNALFATPLIPVLGLTLTYTLLVVGHLVFSGVSAHLLSRYFFKDDRAGFVAGIGFLCAPVLISGIHNGTSEAIAGGWLALCVLALLRFADHGGAKKGVLAAGALVLTCVGGWYAGVCAWIFWLSLLIVGRPEVSRRLVAKRMLLSGALALVVVLPVALSMSSSIDEGHQIGIKSQRELKTVRRSTGSADPVGWVASGDWRSPDFREISRDNEEFIHSHYLGWTLILGAGWIFVRRRKGMGALALSGVAAGLLAMGPVIVRNGQAWVFSDGLVFPMPYFLVEGFPGFASLSLLFRLGMLPMLVLCVAASGVVFSWKKRWWVFALLVFVDLRLLSPVAGLPSVEKAGVSSVFKVLKNAPPGAVMNYPIVGGRPYLYEQTAHEKPVAGRLNLPNNHTSRKLWRVLGEVVSDSPDAARKKLRAVAKKSKTGDCQTIRRQCGYGEFRPTSQPDICRCFSGVRYLVVHQDALARPDMHQNAVRWASEHLTVLASDDKVKVIQLW